MRPCVRQCWRRACRAAAAADFVRDPSSRPEISARTLRLAAVRFRGVRGARPAFRLCPPAGRAPRELWALARASSVAENWLLSDAGGVSSTGAARRPWPSSSGNPGHTADRRSTWTFSMSILPRPGQASRKQGSAVPTSPNSVMSSIRISRRTPERDAGRAKPGDEVHPGFPRPCRRCGLKRGRTPQRGGKLTCLEVL